MVLCFGLIRPYKGIDLLLDAWGQGLDGAELWIVGMARMDTSRLRARAPASVRFDERFVADDELPALFGRAQLVVLPYREAEASGVLFTALAFGRPLLLSDVGAFGELAATGAARLFPARPPRGPARGAAGAAGRRGRAGADERQRAGRRPRSVLAGGRSPGRRSDLYASLLR